MPASWRYAAANAPGASHLRADQPCQDRWACRVLPDGTLVAAVADGAGSAAHSAAGAEEAVNALVAAVEKALLSEAADEATPDWTAILRTAMEAARAVVLVAAEAAQLPARQFACTLLAVLIGPDGGAVGQLGDGVVLVSEALDDWNWVFWPQKGEYANTTFFLTDATALERIEIEPLPPTVADVALLTDGLEALALHFADTAVHLPFITRMMAPLHRTATPTAGAEATALSTALGQFLGSPVIQTRTDDDITLLLATRRPPLSP
jgi:Protein phosphatase 2C